MSRHLTPESPLDVLPILRRDQANHTEEDFWSVPIDGSPFGDYDPEYPMLGHGRFATISTVDGPQSRVLSNSWGSYETGEVDGDTVVSFRLTNRTNRRASQAEGVSFWFTMPGVELIDLGPNYNSLIVAAHGLFHYVSGYDADLSAEIERRVDLVRGQEKDDVAIVSAMLVRLADLESGGKLWEVSPDGTRQLAPNVRDEISRI